MFEKLNQMAEQAAANVSRREFLGRLGRGALVVATAAGGLLALPAVSRGGRAQPRACIAGSASCLNALEGTSCLTIDGYGICQGPKRRGDKYSTTTSCACVTR